MKINVPLSQIRTSKNPDDLLFVQKLGSGIGLAVYDPDVRIGGMCHAMLPKAESYPDMARQNPYMFADTGFPLLLSKLKEMGADCTRLKGHCAGGADFIVGNNPVYAIGRQNITEAMRIFKAHNIPLNPLDIGGSKTRSVYLKVEDGRVWVERD